MLDFTSFNTNLQKYTFSWVALLRHHFARNS